MQMWTKINHSLMFAHYLTPSLTILILTDLEEISVKLKDSLNLKSTSSDLPGKYFLLKYYAVNSRVKKNSIDLLNHPGFLWLPQPKFKHCTSILVWT